MRRFSHFHHRKVWPFWLLAVAWFCASCPLASFGVITWLHEARSFHHQDWLETEVARILVGQPRSSVLALWAKIPGAEEKSPAVIEAGVTKFELGIVEAINVYLPRRAAEGFAHEPRMLAGTCRPSPPHEPPRLG